VLAVLGWYAKEVRPSVGRCAPDNGTAAPSAKTARARVAHDPMGTTSRTARSNRCAGGLGITDQPTRKRPVSDRRRGQGRATKVRHQRHHHEVARETPAGSGHAPVSAGGSAVIGVGEVHKVYYDLGETASACAGSTVSVGRRVLAIMGAKRQREEVEFDDILAASIARRPAGICLDGNDPRLGMDKREWRDPQPPRSVRFPGFNLPRSHQALEKGSCRRRLHAASTRCDKRSKSASDALALSASRTVAALPSQLSGDSSNAWPLASACESPVDPPPPTRGQPEISITAPRWRSWRSSSSSTTRACRSVLVRRAGLASSRKAHSLRAGKIGRTTGEATRPQRARRGLPTLPTLDY